MRLTEDNSNRLRNCVNMLFNHGFGAQFPSPRISNEAAEAMLAVMEPEVKRIDKVLEEVERTGWTT